MDSVRDGREAEENGEHEPGEKTQLRHQAGTDSRLLVHRQVFSFPKHPERSKMHPEILKWCIVVYLNIKSSRIRVWSAKLRVVGWILRCSETSMIQQGHVGCGGCLNEDQRAGSDRESWRR